MEILAQSSTAFVLTHNFQGTHILGASRGHLSDSVIFLLLWKTQFRSCDVWKSRSASRNKNPKTANMHHLPSAHRHVESHIGARKISLSIGAGPYHKFTISFRLKPFAIFRLLEDSGLKPGGCIIHGRFIDACIVTLYTSSAAAN